jgi:hypothetical protein
MRWARLVARVEDRRGAWRVLVGRPERQEDPAADGRIILHVSSRNVKGRHGLD